MENVRMMELADAIVIIVDLLVTLIALINVLVMVYAH
jgi:hypothetical protein